MNQKEKFENLDEELVRNLRERPEELLTANYKRAEKALADFYLDIKGDKYILEPKIKEFRAYFDENLFDRVVHKGSEKIEKVEAESILKSPAQLGYSSNSSAEDEMMGNTNYVFASFNRARSNSSHIEGNNFLIQSRECYVVPADIEHVHEHIHEYDGKMKIYSDNIYRYQDFVDLYSTMCAMIFDNPRQAISFFYYMQGVNYLDKTRAWDEDHIDWYKDANLTYPESSEEIGEYGVTDITPMLRKFKKLYLEYGIIPPFSPELQYRDEVSAVRIS